MFDAVIDVALSLLLCLVLVTVALSLIHAAVASTMTQRLARVVLILSPVGIAVLTAVALFRLFSPSPGPVDVDPAQVYPSMRFAEFVLVIMTFMISGILYSLVGVVPYLIGQWRLKRKLKAG